VRCVRFTIYDLRFAICARLAATEGQPYRSPCHLLRFTICDLRAPGGHGGPTLQITVSPFTIYDLRFARAWRPRRASPTDHRVTFYDLRFAICARLAATEGQPYRSPCHLLRFTICDLRAPGGHGGPALQITVSPFTIYDLRFARAWRPRRASPTDHRVTRSPLHPLTPSSFPSRLPTSSSCGIP
jgi:hypothetical protein